MEKTEIKVSCIDQVLKITDAPILASGGLNEVRVVFDFCEKWNGFAKTAIFYRDEETVYYAVLDENDSCVVPWEVYSDPGYFYFAVYGDKGDIRRTANAVKYKAKKGILDTEMIPPSPTINNFVKSVNGITPDENGNVYTVDEQLYRSGYAADAKVTGEKISELDGKIALERTRIDNLAKLGEGSTTGDAELIDIRVGFDGKQYDSAGNAVRGQISTLNSNLSCVTDNINPEVFTSGGINETTGANEAGSSIRTGYIAIEPNTKYYLNAVDVTARLYFYDSNKTFITYTAGWKKEFFYTTDANTRYCRLVVSTDSYANNIMFCRGEIEDKRYIPHICADDKLLRREYNNDVVTSVTSNLFYGGFVASTGINASTGKSETSSSMMSSVNFIPVAENTKYFFWWTGGTGRAYFYNAAYEYISCTSSWRSKYIFLTPSGTAYIRISVGKDASNVVLKRFTTGDYSLYLPHKTLVDYDAREKISLANKNNPANVIKVCSFNVGKWYDGKTAVPENEVNAQRRKWLDFMGKENIDLMCMQEARPYFDVNQTIVPFDSFLKTNFTNYYDTYETEDHGNAIVTRKPIEWFGYASHGLNTGSLDGVIYCGGKAIQFMCVHLSTETGSEGRRVADMQRIADWLASCEYGIVFGDFNAYSLAEYDVFANYNMANCGDFGQIETWKPGETTSFNCIDNIITTKNIEVSYAYAFNDFKLSDHTPLIARLLVK